MPMDEDYLRDVVAPAHEPIKVTVPEGRSGDWEVARFEVQRDISYMRALRDGRGIPLGTYTRLYCHSRAGLFMSDTPAELNDARELLWSAEGHVLISGLGLGMIPRALLTENQFNTGRVERVTILELEQDVISLVAASLADLPIDIIHVDAFEWVPPEGTRFDWAWHDIWPDMCSDNLPEYARLRRRYARFMAAPQRQLCWGEDTIRADMRRWG